MIKKICAMVLFIFATSFSVTFASMPEEMLIAEVFDNSQTLSKSEIQSLKDKIQDVQQKHYVIVEIAFFRTIGNDEISNAAHRYLNQHYSGGLNGGIVFVVVMDSRNWYIATDPQMDMKIPNAKDIGNRLIKHLRNGDYFEACEDYIDAVDESLNYYEQNSAASNSNNDYYGQNITYDNSDNNYYEQDVDDDSYTAVQMRIAMVAAVLGIFFGIIVRWWLISSMSNVHHEMTASDYLKRETVKFTKNRDTYLYTNTERRAKNNSSGGGHNIGGGNFGGRGNSGGGGGAGGSF